MILALAAYLTAVALIAVGAGALLELACRLRGIPARNVWLVAIGLMIVAFPMGWRTRRASSAPSHAPAVALAPVAGVADRAVVLTAALARPANTVRAVMRRALPPAELPFTVPAASMLARADMLLGLAWGVGSIAIALAFGAAALRTRRHRRRWSDKTVDGVRVLVSTDVGPAVIGVFRPRIVIPEWVLELDESRRALILAHERAHVARRDTSWLLAGVVAVALMPWSPVTWHAWRRLRLAMEIDCDELVLRDHPDAARYASLLVDIAARVNGFVMPAVAIVESGGETRRRVTRMLTVARRPARSLAFAAATGGIVLALGAWTVPKPRVLESNAAPASELVRGAVPGAVRAAVHGAIRPEAVRLTAALMHLLAADPARRAIPDEVRHELYDSLTMAMLRPWQYSTTMQQLARRFYPQLDTVRAQRLVIAFVFDGRDSVRAHAMTAVPESTNPMAEPGSRWIQQLMPGIELPPDRGTSTYGSGSADRHQSPLGERVYNALHSPDVFQVKDVSIVSSYPTLRIDADSTTPLPSLAAQPLPPSAAAPATRARAIATELASLMRADPARTGIPDRVRTWLKQNLDLYLLTVAGNAFFAENIIAEHRAETPSGTDVTIGILLDARDSVIAYRAMQSPARWASSRNTEDEFRTLFPAYDVHDFKRSSSNGSASTDSRRTVVTWSK